MRPREKLSVEERISIALDLIKRERSLEEIRRFYRVSHTTVYKIRNAFLEGGKRALGGVDKPSSELEARVRALEKKFAADPQGPAPANGRGLGASKPRRNAIDSRVR